MEHVDMVGGKNASLGEMIGKLGEVGVRVPGGSATPRQAYPDFLASAGLDRRIDEQLRDLDVDDIESLTAAGRAIRGWIVETPLPERLRDELRTAWEAMSDGRDIRVAVRSSATAEYLPAASVAAQDG